LPHLVRHYKTDKITIRCDKKTPINLDGELRLGKTVEMSLAPEKIRFFYPKGLSWKVNT
jgi:diacylglycerol kinase family enzyme